VVSRFFKVPALVFVSALFCIAQSPPPKTVLDYYELLPDKYFEANREQRVIWMLDPKRGAIVDSKNGYLFAPGDGAQSDIYLSLFKKRNGEFVAAVKHYDSDTNDFTYLEFVVYKDGSWTEVTKSVIPVKINDKLRYEMPRYGRAIRVRNKKGKRMYDLVWTGENFRLRR
jgi:hypothetical protein